MTPFSDPTAVANYAERTARIVPGLRDLHRMTAFCWPNVHLPTRASWCSALAAGWS